MNWNLPDESASQYFGAALARAMMDSDPRAGAVIWLQGDLGAGKTFLVRALLRALGETGPVRSPTYTLMEPYELAGRCIWHMDLYRLADPEELEFLGIRELDESDQFLLVEWPERGRDYLPAPDLKLQMQHRDAGRAVAATASSPRGQQLLDRLRVEQEASGTGAPG
ncbi:tRNA threonylcarbamoyladenosine biosynthesis protein TsaE [Natronospira proteinivora]|uniref:tRNA threonylcarbamoyladenosine biosynthesis protein TsaE n=1 Tax=Natronospira proteinivora TaxID=1807133 RepID=A0ABT1G545_9GAMM|nr:tRNA (adenosine(37)-N6)-threonylcarbamoyltransferase complex ATPase subunit type 1 TsaE [Natronospira proteinivora]MCP1726207.1 tRNA threonylcarbamoyladenosine biosynthesis protein TsaE [Natronospira proteinivora]